MSKRSKHSRLTPMNRCKNMNRDLTEITLYTSKGDVTEVALHTSKGGVMLFDTRKKCVIIEMSLQREVSLKLQYTLQRDV